MPPPAPSPFDKCSGADKGLCGFFDTCEWCSDGHCADSGQCEKPTPLPVPIPVPPSPEPAPPAPSPFDKCSGADKALCAFFDTCEWCSDDQCAGEGQCSS